MAHRIQAFLVDDEAAYVTGVVLPVDGGAKALRPGREQDAMVRKARLMETAAQIDEWLTSPGQPAPR